jgi:DNA polymerase III subunit epsilon
METVLILDTETTGLTPAEGEVIEIAAVRYSLSDACVIEAHSWLVQAESNPAEPVNHIAPASLKHGVDLAWAWNETDTSADGCDAVLAHNSDFDRQWVPEEAERLLALPWIDTCGAITWPRESKPGSSLIHLALDHGLAVVDPHRALSDCLLLARLLTRCAELGHELATLLAPGLRPRALFQALVSFDDREKAKSAGFHWDAPTKRWLRKMVIEETGSLGFRVQEVSK